MNIRSIAVLAIGFASLGMPAVASVVTIEFDALGSGGSYAEDGYLFSSPGAFENSSGALRLYSGTELFISRQDGLPFTLESFNVVFQRTPGPNGWWVTDEHGAGYQLARAGEQPYGFGSFRDVQMLKIFDYTHSPGDYYLFDDFSFSTVSVVPEPAGYMLALTALAALGVTTARRKH